MKKSTQVQHVSRFKESSGSITTPPSARQLVIRWRVPAPRIASRDLRALLQAVLESQFGLTRYALGVHIVGTATMSRLNQHFLRHQGPTDVVTFDYLADTPELDLHGEIFVCLPEITRQAPRFKTSWQDELLRCLVHGVLHLRNYDDQQPSDRKRMKAAEARTLQQLRQHPSYPGPLRHSTSP